MLRVMPPGATLEVTVMYKSLAGIAVAAALSMAAVTTTPANAAPIRNLAGVAEHQSGVEQVQYRRYNNRYNQRRYYAPRYRYGYAPRRYYYGGPYAYRPYPYYPRRYYGGPYVQFGPFGFGVW
jgi:hypothetical protein